MKIPRSGVFILILGNIRVKKYSKNKYLLSGYLLAPHHWLLLVTSQSALHLQSITVKRNIVQENTVVPQTNRQLKIHNNRIDQYN